MQFLLVHKGNFCFYLVMEMIAHPTDLFSRQQIAEITGIDASTLNYWMREHVLRPVEGGAGKGSHRKFAYYEVTLAGILNQLRIFGIGLPALARLSQRFHDAQDWLATHNIEVRNFHLIQSAVFIRRAILLDGSFRWFIRPEDEGTFAGFQLHRLDQHLAWVDLDWEQALTHGFKASCGFTLNQALSPEERNLVWSWNTLQAIEEFERHGAYFEAMIELVPEYPDIKTTLPQHLIRNGAGEWELARRSYVPSWGVIFIGIHIKLLVHQMWAPYLKRKAP